MGFRYKVGDKVKLKSYEELLDSPIIPKTLAKEYADKICIIRALGNNGHQGYYSYVIDSFFFEEKSLEKYKEIDENGNYLLEFT